MIAPTNGHVAENVFLRRARERAADQVIWTEQETATFLRLRRSTVADMARRGDLPSIKLGRHRRFIQQDVLDWLDEQRQRPSRGF